MPLTTTVIGAYPKPDYVPVIDWFQVGDMSRPTGDYDAQLSAAGEEAETLFQRAAAEVIAEQVAAGIDIPTDGEVRRENYVHYHCRHLAGIDFEDRTEKQARGGAYVTALPTVRGKISAKPGHFLPADYRAAQASTPRPVKVTLPGPLTVTDTTADAYYGDDAVLGRDLAAAINAEVLALAEAGCHHIQIDEPVFARRADEALAFGIDNLAGCFHGLPEDVTRIVHICCGYPNYLDQSDYPKADPASYFALADAIEAAPLDQVSLEDAHRHNDLQLLERFEKTAVILGLVRVASSELEPVEAIRARIEAALKHIDASRLLAAPDCGLGLLGRDLARRKLENLAAAAKSI